MSRLLKSFWLHARHDVQGVPLLTYLVDPAEMFSPTCTVWTIDVSSVLPMLTSSRGRLGLQALRLVRITRIVKVARLARVLRRGGCIVPSIRSVKDVLKCERRGVGPKSSTP